jgi:hypothetical protein
MTMSEKTEIIPDEENGATTPENNRVIPIKFNKEIRHLTLDEASLLSQKGLKFETIEKQWSRLLNFAKEDGISAQEFLDALENGRTEKRLNELTKECGGNSEIAQRIIDLEKGKDGSLKGYEELKEYFPQLTEEDLPQEVTDSAKQLGRNILDEYLRFKAREVIAAEKKERQKKENLKSSVGSLKVGGIYRTPENEQFIRGLWNK